MVDHIQRQQGPGRPRGERCGGEKGDKTAQASAHHNEPCLLHLPASPLHDTVRAVTDRIRARSAATRAAYVQRIDAAARDDSVERAHLGCTNLAHGYAAAPRATRSGCASNARPTSPSSPATTTCCRPTQPLAAYPDWIKQAARDVGATAQFAGGVPAMCDGVTQGQAGMELSLFSRDVIAMATAVAVPQHV